MYSIERRIGFEFGCWACEVEQRYNPPSKIVTGEKNTVEIFWSNKIPSSNAKSKEFADRAGKL